MEVRPPPRPPLAIDPPPKGEGEDELPFACARFRRFRRARRLTAAVCGAIEVVEEFAEHVEMRVAARFRFTAQRARCAACPSFASEKLVEAREFAHEIVEAPACRRDFAQREPSPLADKAQSSSARCARSPRSAKVAITSVMRAAQKK